MSGERIGEARTLSCPSLCGRIEDGSYGFAVSKLCERIDDGSYGCAAPKLCERIKTVAKVLQCQSSALSSEQAKRPRLRLALS